MNGEEVPLLKDWSTANVKDRAFRMTECSVTSKSIPRENDENFQVDFFYGKGFDCYGYMIAFNACGSAAAKLLATFYRWNDPNVM